MNSLNNSTLHLNNSFGNQWPEYFFTYNLINFHINVLYAWLIVTSGTNANNVRNALYAGMIYVSIQISIIRNASTSVQLANKCFNAEYISKNTPKNVIQRQNDKFTKLHWFLKFNVKYAKLSCILSLECLLFNFTNNISIFSFQQKMPSYTCHQSYLSYT